MAKKFGKAPPYRKKKKTSHWLIHKVTPKTKYISEEAGFEFTFEPVEDTISIDETKDGYTAKYLVRDDNPTNPSDYGDDGVGFLVSYHRDFDVRKDDIITEDDARKLYQGEKIPQQKDYYIFAVDAYIHSGVALSFAGGFSGRLPEGHERFDVSSVGLILVNKKEIKTRKEAQTFAKGLIENWNQYNSGDVYGMVIETYDKNKKQKTQDATWGYYGYKDAMKELKTYEG